MKSRLTTLMQVERMKRDFAAPGGKQEGAGERVPEKNWGSLKKDLEAFSNTGHRRWASDMLARRKSILKLTGSVLTSQVNTSSVSFKPRD